MVAVAVALPIIGWFASALIGKLADKARSFLGDQYEYRRTSTKGTLKGLQLNLDRIQASIHRADPNKIEHPGLQEWILDLKDASYHAEDVFDKFEYEILKDQVCTSTSHRLTRSARTAVKCVLFLNDNLKRELLEVAKRFDNIVEKMALFLQLVDVERSVAAADRTEMMEWRQTTSTLAQPQVFGRESAADRVREFLVCGSSRRNVSVLPILGIGGVGKTTLAQHVYSLQKVTDADADGFNLKAWVCVSDRFERRRLMKEIIESASLEVPRHFHSLQNLDSIEQVLKEGLKGKKFLLVLDDVWNVASGDWENLFNTLSFGEEGSKVIVTTRDQKVADMVKTTASLPLEGLEYEDYWKLFVQCAFRDEIPEEHPKLEFIGRQITKRLGGLPLAAKTIGGALKFNLDEDHWRGVLGSKLWHGDHGRDVLAVLELSYEHLPEHLKQCFVYCSLFPKAYRFKKDALVRIWMAHGFIQPSKDKISTLEEVGRTYVDELVSRSLFEGQATDSEFVIHDLLHDLAEFLSLGECFRVEGYESDEEEPEEIPKQVRHLHIRAENRAVVFDDKYTSRSLRSLVVSGPSGFVLSEESLKGLTSLRVLIFENLHLNWSPEPIDRLVHLRYLMFFNVTSNVDKLPESLHKLYHLQVLDLEYCHKLPKKVNNLISLRRLVANAVELSKIEGVGKLTALQNLEKYNVSKESGHGIGQLKDMSQLRILDISGLENVGSKEEASEAMLNKKKLSTLNLTWDTRSRILNPDEVLDGLRPHRNLKKLAIRGYTGINSPSWLKVKSLTNLDHVHLKNCSGWQVLPPFGDLPFLKSLELLNMASVKQIGHEFYGNDSSSPAFPYLERLVIDTMPMLTEWLGVEGRQLFPRLSYLGIRDCDRLRGALPLPSELKKLDVRQKSKSMDESPNSLVLRLDKDINILAEWIPLHSLSSLESTYISTYVTISFSAEMEDWFRNLTSLKILELVDCDDLQYLPSCLTGLSSLEELSINGCCCIKSLAEEVLPASLQKLTIRDFHPELIDWCEEDGPNWHKIAHIPVIGFTL